MLGGYWVGFAAGGEGCTMQRRRAIKKKHTREERSKRWKWLMGRGIVVREDVRFLSAKSRDRVRVVREVEALIRDFDTLFVSRKC